MDGVNWDTNDKTTFKELNSPFILKGDQDQSTKSPKLKRETWTPGVSFLWTNKDIIDSLVPVWPF